MSIDKFTDEEIIQALQEQLGLSRDQANTVVWLERTGGDDYTRELMDEPGDAPGDEGASFPES